MKNFFFLLIGVILILGSIYTFFNQKIGTVHPINAVKIGDTRIKVELATTPEARAQGLSGREYLQEDSGMLFIFETPAQYGFWMKDMKFAIDIIWISDKFRVVDVTHRLIPETYPQSFAPKEAVKYVLEVPSGFAEKNGIDIGDLVYFD